MKLRWGLYRPTRLTINVSLIFAIAGIVTAFLFRGTRFFSQMWVYAYVIVLILLLYPKSQRAKLWLPFLSVVWLLVGFVSIFYSSLFWGELFLLGIYKFDTETIMEIITTATANMQDESFNIQTALLWQRLLVFLLLYLFPSLVLLYYPRETGQGESMRGTGKKVS